MRICERNHFLLFEKKSLSRWKFPYFGHEIFSFRMTFLTRRLRCGMMKNELKPLRSSIDLWGWGGYGDKLKENRVRWLQAEVCVVRYGAGIWWKRKRTNRFFPWTIIRQRSGISDWTMKYSRSCSRSLRSLNAVHLGLIPASERATTKLVGGRSVFLCHWGSTGEVNARNLPLIHHDITNGRLGKVEGKMACSCEPNKRWIS